MKLTKAQKAFLVEVYSTGAKGTSCIDSYHPAKALVSHGLIEPRQSSFGHTAYVATELGIEYVEALV